MKWLLAVAAASIVFCAVASATLLPLVDGNGFRYLFVWGGAFALTELALGAVAITVIAYRIVLTLAGRLGAASEDARAGRWMAPLCWLAVVAVGIVPAVPGAGIRFSPLAYFFYDLRWWWLCSTVLLALIRADRVLGSRAARAFDRIASWPERSRLLLLDATVFAGLITVATVTSPNMRFNSNLNGDEPKYLRFCELWYQGGGLDITQKTLMADQPLDAEPHLLRSVGLLFNGTRLEGQSLRSDLRQFFSHPLTFRWNRVHGNGYFVVGKRGGVYQLYQPGLSVVLFPAYFVDRYFLAMNAGPRGEFPDRLEATNAALLLIYGACGVALFRFLRNALNSDGLAWIWSVIAFATLPVSAFAFQLYPEVLAALLIILVANEVLFHTRHNVAVAIGCGFAASYLCWLHPRFLLVSVCLATAAIVRMRGTTRRLFMISYLAVLATVGAFAFHVTGSWAPTALWSSAGFGINTASIPINVVAYFLDRVWGLVPHAPLLLLAFPGLVLLGRSRVDGAIFVVAIVAALLIPAAGHTLSAAGSTPDRLVTAVVPLCVWPVAVLVREMWRFVAARVISAVLTVLSLVQAVAYDWNHSRVGGAMHDASASGWKLNSAFPTFRDLADSSRNDRAVLIVSVILILTFSWWTLRRVRVLAPRRRGAVSSNTAFVVVLALVVGSSFVFTRATRRWITEDYLVDPASAHILAAEALTAFDRCRICFTSRDGPIDWRALEPNTAKRLQIDVQAHGLTLALMARIDPEASLRGFGRILVDFGDRSTLPWSGIVGERQINHRYHQPGTYTVATWFQSRNGAATVVRESIAIAATGEH